MSIKAKLKSKKFIKGIGLNLGVVLLGMGAMSGMIFSTSAAVFNDTKTNESSWTTGSVTLAEDSAASALFSSASNGLLNGGQVIEKCINVNYTGNLTSGIGTKFYATSSGALQPYLNVRVEEGHGGGFANCTGFTSDAVLFNGSLESLSTTHGNYDNGLGSWAPNATNQNKTYKFVVTVSTDNGAQNKNGAAVFSWEARG